MSISTVDTQGRRVLAWYLPWSSAARPAHCCVRRGVDEETLMAAEVTQLPTGDGRPCGRNVAMLGV